MMPVTYQRRLNLQLLDINKICIIIFYVCQKNQLALGLSTGKRCTIDADQGSSRGKLLPIGSELNSGSVKACMGSLIWSISSSASIRLYSRSMVSVLQIAEDGNKCSIWRGGSRKHNYMYPYYKGVWLMTQRRKVTQRHVSMLRQVSMMQPQS